MKTLILLLFVSSCSFFIRGNEAPKSAKKTYYSIEFSDKAWKEKKDKRSDYVFENEDGRILLSNSFCEEFQEGNLETLAKNTFKTVKGFWPTSGNYTTFHNREAYQLAGTGLVDGVKVNLRLLNTRRNNCYFDFVSINPDINIKSEADFQNFLKSVEFK